MGGGGLYSTVGDYLKFAQMILHGGRFNGVQALQPETVALMSRNAMGDLVCNPMKTAIPWATNDVDFVAGMKVGVEFPDQSRGAADGTLGGQSGVGGSGEFLLLDRSGEAGRGRVRDSGAAVLRREGGADVRGV